VQNQCLKRASATTKHPSPMKETRTLQRSSKEYKENNANPSAT